LNNLGPRSVFKISSLVDMLEGCTFSEIKTFRRPLVHRFCWAPSSKVSETDLYVKRVLDARFLEK
jgi:hypothetical protein